MFKKAIKGIKAYKLWTRAYDLVTNWGKNVETKDGVVVKSAWQSKINWTQAIGLLSAGVTFFGFDLPAETQAQILAGITGMTGVVTWALRTWFNKTVTPDASK